MRRRLQELLPGFQPIVRRAHLQCWLWTPFSVVIGYVGGDAFVQKYFQIDSQISGVVGAVAITLMGWHYYDRQARERYALLHAASDAVSARPPVPVLITSWTEDRQGSPRCTYIGFHPLDAPQDTPFVAGRVVLSAGSITIPKPEAADLLTDGMQYIICLRDGRAALLEVTSPSTSTPTPAMVPTPQFAATTPRDTMICFDTQPLVAPPRHLPWLVSLQLFTLHGTLGLLLMPLTICVLGVRKMVLDLLSFPPGTVDGYWIGLSICAVLSLVLLLASLATVTWGYRSWRALRRAPMGWARVAEVVPLERGTFQPPRQRVQFVIRDTAGHAYHQAYIVRKPGEWPRAEAFPILFDPRGRAKPIALDTLIGPAAWRGRREETRRSGHLPAFRMLVDIVCTHGHETAQQLARAGFCRLDSQGRIVPHPGLACLMLLVLAMMGALTVVAAINLWNAPLAGHPPA